MDDVVAIAGNDLPAGAQIRWLTGRGGVRLRTIVAPALGNPRGSVLLCNGRTEFIEKYFEVMRELQGRGFCVLSLDWRGQGLSDHELPDRQKGHFRSFDDPADDLGAVVRESESLLPRPHIVLAHSMGGGISLRAMQQRKIEVAAAVFSAPMWGIARLKGLVKGFARLATALGFGGAFAPGVTKRWKREAFKGNTVTNDEGRHQRCQDLIAADQRLALSGVTLGWLAAAADLFEEFRKPGALAHLSMPILVASAEQEMLVDNASHNDLEALLPDCTHLVFKGAKHEILMEKDDVRAKFWAAFDDFVDKAVPRGG